MNEYDSPNYAQFTYEKKNEGKVRLCRTLMVFAYVLYLVAFFLVCYLTRVIPVFALAPLTLWIIIFFTWRFTNPEYEYSITSGILTFSVIYGGRTRSKRFEKSVKEMETIAPLSKLYSHKIEDYKPTRIYEGSSSHDSPDAYFALFENEDGEHCVYYFEATARALKILRHYNVKTVVTDVRY